MMVSICRTDLNWPCRKEPFGILHFDLAELKEKKGEEAFKICRMMYAWWFLVVFLVSWNFISAIAITAAVGDNDIYHGINIFYSLLMFIIGTVISALSFYKTYETLGDDYDKQKKYAQGSLVLTCIFMIIVRQNRFIIIIHTILSETVFRYYGNFVYSNPGNVCWRWKCKWFRYICYFSL